MPLKGDQENPLSDSLVAAHWDLHRRKVSLPLEEGFHRVSLRRRKAFWWVEAGVCCGGGCVCLVLNCNIFRLVFGGVRPLLCNKTDLLPTPQQPVSFHSLTTC
jgi:hypothetical protein